MKPQSLATGLGSRIDDFRKQIRLIQVLCNPGLKTRHWKKLKEILVASASGGEKIDANCVETLNFFKGIDAMKHIDDLEDVSETASKEFAIEESLDKMLALWEPVDFELKDWRTTGTSILAGQSVVMISKRF